MVTGVSFRAAELSHKSAASTAKNELQPELRKLDQDSGDVIEARTLPADFLVGGTEADGDGNIWCGDPHAGKLRLVELAGAA